MFVDKAKILIKAGDGGDGDVPVGHDGHLPVLDLDESRHNQGK